MALLASSTADSRSVEISYEVLGLGDAGPGGVEVAVYRSADDRFDPSEDHRVGSGRLVADGPGRGTLRIDVTGGLRPTPARPFVLAVADPGDELAETDEANNVAAFRKRVVGAVTHGGIQGSSYPPDWAVRFSEALREAGYDAVITFTWAGESRTPGAAAKQGPRLANAVLHTSLLFPEDEPVDLHLIAHSQGAVVTSQALLTLREITTTQIAAGYVRASLLDPHAANNNAPGQYDVVEGIGGWFADWATWTYQALAKDPPVILPAFVDEAEVFYQHAMTAFDGYDWPSNLYGQAPIYGRATYHDLTAPGMAHTGPTGVQPWYWFNVLPTLAEGGRFRNPVEVEGRLVSTPGRTVGEVTYTSDASPAYAGRAAPGGTIRLIGQPGPEADLVVLAETTVDADGRWSLDAGPLPPGHHRMIVRAIVPPGKGPWPALHPLLPMGRLVIHPGVDRVIAEGDRPVVAAGEAEPPLRRTVDGPRGLTPPVPARVATEPADPPRPFRLTPARERRLSRLAERLLIEPAGRAEGPRNDEGRGSPGPSSGLAEGIS